MHPLLQRQLRRHVGSPEALPPEWRRLVQAIDDAYQAHDEDRKLIERSLEITSKELIQRYDTVRSELVERLKAEEQLRLWAKVFESSSEGIFITDAERRIISVNRAFVEITGHRPEEVTGRPPSLLGSGLYDGSVFEAIWASIDAVGHWQGEIRDRRKSGEAYPAWVAVTAARNAHGAVTNYIAIFSDISDRKAAEERIRFLAHHDCLTGLPNRSLLRDRLEQAIAKARRKGERVALLFIDLDRFKTINDSLGHHVGDSLLQLVAERLKACLRSDDTVCRLGGDEFIIVLSEIANVEDAAKVAAKVGEVLAEPYCIAGAEFHVTPSTGISLFPDDGLDIDTLIRNADAAMYCAKDNGRNNYQFFTADLNTRALERLSLETSLRRALEREELVLHYQPQVDLRTGRITGVEALVRWLHPEMGLVYPERFIPVAEDTGLIVPLGEWVLRTACAQAKAWNEAAADPVGVAVNLSARQFRQHDLVRTVARTLDETGLDPRRLELELTETMVMQRPDEAILTLGRLKAMGLQLAIDDFGTGYSSLAALKRFPIDRLKIDRSFVREISVDPDDAAIVYAIISLARSLQLNVVAEGVDAGEQVEFLRRHRCDVMQGFLFFPPLPEDEATRFVLGGGRSLREGDAAAARGSLTS